ncbi:MAG TPA: hypothetical protein PLL77_09895 [Pyrinomonadaceae bacterium]|nr:hypothetical protein [Pyrinomonadaceae bacterium]
MRRSLTDIFIVMIVGLAMVTGCTRTNESPVDKDAPNVERGRLRFSKGINALRIGDQYAFRDVTHYFFFNGKEWEPPGDPKLADRINWCDLSPNPDIEMLRCTSNASENYRYTYLIKISNDQPEVVKLDEGLGSVWINDEGHWLLFRKMYYNVVTGETIPVKGMPWADDPNSSSPVTYVLAISPDKRTVIGSYDLAPDDVNGDKLVKLWNIDTVSGTREIRFASLTKYPFLTDHEDPTTNILPPPAAQKKFVWKRDTSGRDLLVEPKLLGVFVRKPPTANKK